MCGIAGYLGQGNRALLERMAAALVHRGPDGEGLFINLEAGIGLAHRRLAIIDLSSAADQPMASCRGRYQVVFNGEIYNFKTLADELAGLGYEFNMNSDTAILGPLYDRYGIEGLRMLNGIFALAIWDEHRRELILARDGLGVKPMYFSCAQGSLSFASELKALLLFPGIGRRLDESALVAYLVNLWSAGKHTLLREVEKLPPGHVIRATRHSFKMTRWYSPPVPAAPRSGARSLPALKQAILDTFDKAVAGQCVSDVPIGAFLSGGVDSSAIVASMVKSGNAPKRTYCIGFQGPTMRQEGFGDDLMHARLMADCLSVPLTEIRVTEPEPEEFLRLPYLLDEPQADPAALFVAAIAKAARADGIKVLLSGTGGDDIFSGYRRHRIAALRSRLGPFARFLPARLLSQAQGAGPVRRRLAKLGYLWTGTDEDFLVKSFEFNQANLVLKCLSADLAADGANTWLCEALAHSKGKALLDRMLYLELHGFLPDHNLNYTDKASMAHGVEVRVPFLDVELVRLAGLIPWQLKMRGLQEKWIFKHAMANRLPSKVLHRKKTGFGAPVRAWLRHGKLRELALDVVASQRFRERGLFSQAAVQQLLRETISGARDGAYLVLAILMMEFWLQSFVDNSSTMHGCSKASGSATAVAA